MNEYSCEPKSNIFIFLFHPRNGLIVFSAAILLVYCITPLILNIYLHNHEMLKLIAAITAVSVVAMWVGFFIPIFDYRFEDQAGRLIINPQDFIVVTWILFLTFILITFLTAPTIPIISALLGADANSLSQERGEFLKGREGFGIILLYISTFLVNTIVPYSIILLYMTKSPIRHYAAIIFFLFCISFMQKALFLNLILPLLSFMAITKKLRGKVFFMFFLSSVMFLIMITAISLQGEEVASAQGEYFTASYLPHNPFDYFLWRSIAVPIFTATDTLIVHDTQFDGRWLLGSTSTLLAAIFGHERINLERIVFEYQFGSWNEIANSNSVFVVDAFVNFGWLGVLIFGLTVGQIFRLFYISKDDAFRSLWSIFAFILFSAPLIGMMLSNGFAFMLFIALFISIQRNENHI